MTCSVRIGRARTILVELQQVRQAYFKDRTLFMSSHLLRRQRAGGGGLGLSVAAGLCDCDPQSSLEKKSGRSAGSAHRIKTMESVFIPVEFSCFSELLGFVEPLNSWKRIWIAGYTFSNIPGVGDHADGI